MAIESTNVPQVNSSSTTFSGWWDITNQMANAFNNVVLTSDTGVGNTTAGGSNVVATVGTVTHNGNLAVYGLTANTVKAASGNLTFQSTVVILDSASSLKVTASITSNTIIVSSNATFNGPLVANGVATFNANLKAQCMNVTSNTVTIGNSSANATVYVYGNIETTGNVIGFDPSDPRLKENMYPINRGLLSCITKLVPAIEFDWNENAPVEGHAYGVDASQLQQYFPSAVKMGEDGYLKVNYPALIPILLGMIQMQSERIDVLERSFSGNY